MNVILSFYDIIFYLFIFSLGFVIIVFNTDV